MFKFFRLVLIISLIGAGVLSLTAPDYSLKLIFFVGVGMLVAGAFKLILDIFVHYRTKHIDRTSSVKTLERSNPRIVYSIEDYVRERNRKN